MKINYLAILVLLGISTILLLIIFCYQKSLPGIKHPDHQTEPEYNPNLLSLGIVATGCGIVVYALIILVHQSC